MENIDDILKEATAISKNNGYDQSVDFLLEYLMIHAEIEDIRLISKIRVYFKKCSQEIKNKSLEKITFCLENYNGNIYLKSDLSSELSAIHELNADINNAINYNRYAKSLVHPEDSSYLYKHAMLHEKCAPLLLKWGLSKEEASILFLHDLLVSYLFKICWEMSIAIFYDEYHYKSNLKTSNTRGVESRLNELRAIYVPPFPFDNKNAIDCFMELAPTKNIKIASLDFISIMLDKIPSLYLAEREKFNHSNVGVDIVHNYTNEFISAL